MVPRLARSLLLTGIVGCTGDPDDPVDSDTEDTDTDTDVAETDTETDVVDTGPEPVVCPAFTVELGTGQGFYIPLVEGDRVVMVHGGQGGWHLWTAARVTGGPILEVRSTAFA